MYLEVGAKYKRLSDGLTYKLLKATENRFNKRITVVLRNVEDKRDMRQMDLEKFKDMFELENYLS